MTQKNIKIVPNSKVTELSEKTAKVTFTDEKEQEEPFDAVLW